MIKQKILDSICYTELVFGRINKKLKINLSPNDMETYIYKCLLESDEYVCEGKNFYFYNRVDGIRITVNSNTYRVITADRVLHKV